MPFDTLVQGICPLLSLSCKVSRIRQSQSRSQTQIQVLLVARFRQILSLHLHQGLVYPGNQSQSQSQGWKSLQSRSQVLESFRFEKQVQVTVNQLPRFPCIRKAL